MLESRDGLHRTGVALFVAAALLCSACGSGSDQNVLELPRSARDLEAAALRGDSMAALIAAAQALTDTLVRTEPGALTPEELAQIAALKVAEATAASIPAVAKPSGTGDGMTQRAVARADSMARASAESLARRLAPAANRGTGDSLRGVLKIERTMSGPRVTLLTTEVGKPVVLSGMATTDLARLEGLEVVVRGARIAQRELAVSSFVVRAANGVPVSDGVLINRDGVWSLQITEGGHLALGRTPTAEMREFAGERVWFARGESSPPTFGVIARRR